MNENTLANPTTFVQYAGIEALEGMRRIRAFVEALNL